MATTAKKKRKSESSSSHTWARKKAKTTTDSGTRDKLEVLYDLELQPPCNGFWTGRVFASTGAKDRAQRRLLPPMGVSVFGAPKLGWLEPISSTADVCDWLRCVLKLNGHVICREFREENTIRHQLKEDESMKLHLKMGASHMDVDARTFFRVGSMRYGSWTLYGRLLMFLDKHGYDVDRAGSQRSHVLTFVATKLPLMYIKHVMEHDCDDDQEQLQLKLLKTVDNSLTCFALVRNALYGYSGNRCGVAANSNAGIMALSVGRNCGQRLRQLIKENEMIQKHVLGDIHETNKDAMCEMGVTTNVLSMHTMFKALQVDTRIRDIDEYNALYESRHRTSTINRGMHVIEVEKQDVMCMFDDLVKRVYGSNGAADDPQIFHGNVSSASCLLSLCYGGRSMGVLACDEIVPMQLRVLHDLDQNEHESIMNLIAMSSIDNMVVIRSTCKDPAFRANADVNAVNIDEATNMPRIILWDLLYESYKRVYPDRDVTYSARVIFFKLLESTRAWLYEYAKLKRGDIEWITYPLHVDGVEMTIRMINRTKHHIHDIRQPVNDIYEMMRGTCTDVMTRHTEIPPTGTHVMRRLYVSIAFSRYAQGTTTMGAFIRVNLGHRSGHSSHSYDHIRIVSETDDEESSTCGTSCVSKCDHDKTVSGLMATILEMKGDMTKMATMIADGDELFDGRVKWLENRVSELEADVSNLQHTNSLMNDHVDTVTRLEWRVSDLEAKL